MTILGITVITILSGHITMFGTDLTALRGALAGTTLGGACITHGLQVGVGDGIPGTTVMAGALTGAGEASVGDGILGIMATAAAGDTVTARVTGVPDQEFGMTATMPEEMVLMNITETEAAEE